MLWKQAHKIRTKGKFKDFLTLSGAKIFLTRLACSVKLGEQGSTAAALIKEKLF